MKKAQEIVILIIVLCVLGFIMTIFDYLALHDIYKDYVSFHIIRDLNITLSGELPDWTSTKGEWDIVRISYLFRFIFFIFCTVVMVKLVNKLRTNKHE